jgi:PAS domain S-box-containing protein
MKDNPISTSNEDQISELEALRGRLAAAERQLAEAQDLVHAIQSGDVDAVVVSGPDGDQVFTLKGAEYAYRALVEAMNEGAATLSPDGMVLYCNGRLSELLGIPMEQVIGNAVTNFVAFDTRAVFDALLTRAQSGDSGKDELEFLSSQGQNIPVYVSVREMKAVETPALCMVVTDLRERKKRDEVVAAGRLATSILDSAAEAIAVCDEGGTIIRANKAMEELCGFNPLFERFETVMPLQVVDRPSSSEKQFSISGALSGLTERAREVCFSRNDGHSIYLLLGAAPIKAASAVVGCVVTMTDITERKKAEGTLKQQADLLRLSFDAIIVWQPERGIESWNHGAEQLYGYSESEALGRSTLELLKTKRSVPLAEVMAMLHESGNWEGELRHTTKDGREIFVSSRHQLIVGSDGVERILQTNRDITESKQAAQALIRAEKLASVGRMASTIAHEINNPLEAIGNAVYLAMTDPGISPQAKEYLEMAMQELERVTHIARQTLAFHRENSAPQLVDLRETVEGVLRIFEVRMKSRGITFERRFEDAGRIRAFGSEIRQVISNLLTNSMDAVQGAGRIICGITPAASNNGVRKLRLTIADTGCGIKPEQLAAIFEPFFTTKEMYGTGLGLWVSKQIAEKHGARIRAHSKPGKGSVFSITFPVAEES